MFGCTYWTLFVEEKLTLRFKVVVLVNVVLSSSNSLSSKLDKGALLDFNICEIRTM
jgi:hypothetical protein